MPQKITKAISSSGLCSRRDAKKLILEGRVKVNGKALTQDDTGITVNEDDKIEVEGKEIPAKLEPFICIYHKPKGLIVTHNDPKGRPTIFEKLPKDMPRVISVGRLDLNSEGLLLLTNDGDLARELEKSDLERVYKVRVFGTPSENTINKIKKGVKIEGITYKAEDIKLPLPLRERGGVRVHSEDHNKSYTRDYSQETLKRAKELRKNSTDAEKYLWHFLRNRQCADCKFKRQVPIEKYIVDFVCLEEKLIIEIDGGQHAKQQEYDKSRTNFLEEKGFKVLRFWNNDVLQNIEGVLETVYNCLTPSPHPSPSKGEGVKSHKSNTWLEVTLTEGKNREIRKLFDHFYHPVNRIIRIKYGKYKLGTLKKGEIKLVDIKQ